MDRTWTATTTASAASPTAGADAALGSRALFAARNVMAHPTTIAMALAALLLAGCSREEGAAPAATAPADTAAPAPPEAPAASAPDPGYTAAESLPPTRPLLVTVEGQEESREARLFLSPQNYAIYVLPQLEMSPEEPCCDLAWARVDEGFTMRIERIDEAAGIETLREDMVLALSSVGSAVDGPVPAFDDGVEAAVELSLRAVGEGVSVGMMIVRVDGGRYRVTLHLPHREAMEGIAPSLSAMLGSLRTTGPRPAR